MGVVVVLRIYLLSAAADVNPLGFCATTALQLYLHARMICDLTLYVKRYSCQTKNELEGPVTSHGRAPSDRRALPHLLHNLVEPKP